MLLHRSSGSPALRATPPGLAAADETDLAELLEPSGEGRVAGLAAPRLLQQLDGALRAARALRQALAEGAVEGALDAQEACAQRALQDHARARIARSTTTTNSSPPTIASSPPTSSATTARPPSPSRFPSCIVSSSFLELGLPREAMLVRSIGFTPFQGRRGTGASTRRADGRHRVCMRLLLERDPLLEAGLQLINHQG